MALGGALIVIGPFITWVSVPFLGGLNLFSLFAAGGASQGLAWVPVIVGAAVALSAAMSESGGVGRTLAVGVAGLLIGLLAIPLAVSLANEVGRSGGLAELGLGSWATAAGAVLMFVGAVARGVSPRPQGPRLQPASASAADQELNRDSEPAGENGQEASATPATTDAMEGAASRSDRQPRHRTLLKKSVVPSVLVLLLVVAGLVLWRVTATGNEPTVDTSTPGWATLVLTSNDDERPQIEVPLVWTDQARVCWDVVGDLEKFEVVIFGDEVNEGFVTSKPGRDCRYFSPSISHAAATDCATVSAFHEGNVRWMLVVQQEKGEAYGLSGINSTYQYGLLDNPCTGEQFDVPPGFVDCEDGTYAKSESDCTWAERVFEQPYEPAGYPGWTCYPDTGECIHEEGGFVPEGPQDVGSYCDQSGCYLDY